MCGRFTFTAENLAEAAADLDARLSGDALERYRPRFNVAPSDTHWIVVLDEAGTRLIVPAVWGFATRTGRRTINVRAETALTDPPFRGAFWARRCVVVADGFFEWTKDAKARRPIWYHAPDRKLVPLGGLWQRGDDGLFHFAVVTTEANELVAQVHDRMPVVLRGPGRPVAESASAWLGEPSPELLAPVPADLLTATEVSQRVNSPRNDDAACLDPPVSSR